ncbi:MAG: DNA gyrase inhibitor YacG [Rhizobacter sp.]|nr:DNA gyrase inhibitor YacG [Rhizobacter sp.]
MSSAPTPSPAKRRIVTCPTCGGESVYAPENAFRPFCSERCKNVDFGAWASESYRVPAKPPAPGESAGDASDDGH